MIHIVKGFGVVNKAEVDVFLELFCFFDDQTDVGNLISGSSVFSNESVLCIRWPKYWHFSFSISPSNEHSGLISFRMGWLDLLAVQRTMDWLKIGKGVCEGCILSLCLFNLCAEYIMRNAWLDEAQAGIKIVKRNINYLRNADDTTLIAESEEELESFLMKVKKLA